MRSLHVPTPMKASAGKFEGTAAMDSEPSRDVRSSARRWRRLTGDSLSRRSSMDCEIVERNPTDDARHRNHHPPASRPRPASSGFATISAFPIIQPCTRQRAPAGR
jgi:hypothetical protein